MSESSTPNSKARRFFDGLLFGVVAILLFASVFVLVSAPVGWLWLVAIFVSECGHFVGFGALLLAVVCWQRGRVGRIFAVLALISAGLCVSPAVRAAMMARSLPARCTAAFGTSYPPRAHENAFAWLDLFRAVSISGVTVTEFVYGQNGPKPLKLDLYRAKDSSAPEPVVIMVVGGAWHRGSRKQLPALNAYLAREHYAVAAIDYRHTPKWPFPAAVDDVFYAVDFLKKHARELKLDTSRIALIGRSAGGQIALTAAYAGKEPAIRGVASFYAPTDLVLGYDHPSARGILDSQKVLEEYLRGSPTENPAAYAAASPVNFVGSSTPPTLLLHGGLDSIVWPRQSEMLATRLAQAGRPHLYLNLPWATHGCDANLSGPSGQLSRYAIDRFLASIFAPAK